MKVNFVGGDDVQRSLNHSDSRCVNLIPSLNDKGDIAAYYGAPGLTLEVTNPASAVGSGIYTASNGRCFEVAGTTLYELTETGGVISTTSRGTVTVGNPIYRMSDNGIEMILVNGTDGWLFTFSTNALQKIKVATDTFTVTIASPAVFTQSAHGLVAGDALRLTTTTDSVISDTVLAALSPSSITSLGNSIAIAPANDYVYAAGGTTIYQFLRNADTGLLSNLSPLTVTDSGNGIRNIALSNDGVSAYTTSTTATSYIKTWDVSLATGQISASAFANNNLGTVAGVPYVAPADNFVYVTDVVSGRIYQYSRAVTGELTALSPAYITVTTPSKMCIPADGEFAYVLSGGNILVLDRNNTTGLITQTPVETKASGAASTADISLSSDDLFLYTANSAANNVSMFSRNASTGVLTALTGSPLSISALAGAIAVSADDVSVYVTNTTSAAITMLIRDTSTGILTLADTTTIATDTSPYDLVIAPDDNNVYTINGAGSVSMFSRNATATQVGLPTGLSELTTYYVLAAGLTADEFRVSETAGGTAVSTSGQQAGVHTYTTLGYGFPEGAKTVSYMNGRFVALEPSTQNFYVSEVLDGKWWDALNVQTVDSNPDYVIGEIVSHNELIVFCDDSGEVFYDSGTTPTPFVRNTSGIFEVGCVAPYSICNLDNQVFWLGGNKNGEGIVYKLQGYSPIRISTHSIEYAIQGMTSISDARAFSYQQDGHHFYCLTFPTGDKTYCYDVNTGLWHERANYVSTYSRWVAQEHAYFAGKHLVLSYADGKIYSLSNSVYTYGTEARKWLRSFSVPTQNMNRTRHTRLQLDCEVGVGDVVSTFAFTGGTISNLSWVSVAHNGTIYCASTTLGFAATSTDGVTWTAAVDMVDGTAVKAYLAANSTLFAAILVNSTGSIYTSTDGIVWTARSNGSRATDCIAYGDSKFIAIGNNGGTIQGSTSADGITWAAIAAPPAIGPYRTGHNNHPLIFDDTNWILVGAGSASSTSTDGVTWSARTMPSSQNWISVASNGTRACAITSGTPGAYSDDNGVTWVATTLPTTGWTSINAIDGIFVLVGGTGTHYFSDDAITWTAATGTATSIYGTVVVGSDIVGVGTGAATSLSTLTYDEPNISLRWSDDGGHTFNTAIDRSAGTASQYNKRVVWHRLGMTKGQPRVYEISGEAPTKAVLINVHLD